ncbi:Mbeg1-like protein [Fredinandcohnia sp. 179-A 10B2 NHS]|uniref:Mbeg1-like protein n=1 Tax=Fredinandcohnia sp. 179-A 10B2 NHS TaxID=3235176 RepID=UPI0039A0F85B
MSLSNLTEEEKYILLQLSYLDLPKNLRPSENKPITIERIIEELGSARLDEGSQKKFDEIKAYINNNENAFSPLKDIRLVGYENNNPTSANNSDGSSYSGFVGYAFIDKEGNGTALFRGSEDYTNVGHVATDWVSNLDAGLGVEIRQQREANAFYERFIQGLDGEQYVFGHSKGGNLAAYVLVNNLDERLSSYIVNGAPLYWWNLTQEQKDALRGERNTFIVHEGDMVSSLGYAQYVDKTIAINDLDDGLMYPHGLESVNFTPTGDFEKSFDGQSKERTYANAAVASIMYLVSNLPKVQIYKVSVYIREAVVQILEAAVKGIKRAIEFVKDQITKLISTVKELTQKIKAEITQFFNDLAKKAAIAFVKLVAKMGGYFPVEPYLKVNIDRLYYHAARLENLKRRVNALNDRIDSLYWEVDLLDIDNILRADILTSFNTRLNQNINYLQNAAQLLEHNESKLVGKARIIR